MRATDPRDLRAAATAGHDIIGSDTDRGIADAVRGAAVIVAAWGHHGTLLSRKNDDPKPFVWHKTADEIIAKVQRGRAALAQVKSATQD